MRLYRILLLAPLALATGCASIVNGTQQSLSVNTHENGEQVVDASCKLNNDKGTWFVKTPGTVTVHRSYENLNVNCTKENIAPGVSAFGSSTKGMAFGNILFGGVIGAGVDVYNGAAYDYPNLLNIEMGKTVKLKPAVDPTKEEPVPDKVALEKEEPEKVVEKTDK